MAPAPSSISRILSRRNMRKARNSTMFLCAGSAFSRGADFRGPDSIGQIAPGPRQSAPQPQAPPEQRNASYKAGAPFFGPGPALSALFRASLRLMVLRAGHGRPPKKISSGNPLELSPGEAPTPERPSSGKIPAERTAGRVKMLCTFSRTLCVNAKSIGEIHAPHTYFPVEIERRLTQTRFAWPRCSYKGTREIRLSNEPDCKKG